MIPEDTQEEIQFRLRQWPKRKLTVEVEYIDANGIDGIFGAMIKKIVVTHHKDVTNHEMFAVLGAVAGATSNIVADRCFEATSMKQVNQALMLYESSAELITNEPGGVIQVQPDTGGL